METLILESGDYIQVFENCPFRKGWVVVLQVSKLEWNEHKE